MTQPTIKTIEQVKAEIRSKPGVSVARQKVDYSILVETTQNIYELKVHTPANGLVYLSGGDPRFHEPALGQFLGSIYDTEGKLFLEDWIAKSLRMQIRFKNGVFVCPPALSCRVQGAGWSYEVF